MENMNENKKVEKFHLDDGRIAERHLSLDADGNEVVEVYSEPKRTLNLEKRVKNNYKKVLAEQVVETIVDGNVVEQKVTSIEPPSPQLVQHIRVAEEVNKNPNGFVTAQQLTDAVVTGVTTAMQAQAAQAPVVEAMAVPARTKKPAFSAQSIIEERAEEGQKKDSKFIGVLGVMVVAQLIFFGYVVYVNFFAGGF